MEDYVLVNNFSAILLWRAITLLVDRDVSQEELVMGKHALWHEPEQEKERRRGKCHNIKKFIFFFPEDIKSKLRCWLKEQNIV